MAERVTIKRRDEMFAPAQFWSAPAERSGDGTFAISAAIPGKRRRVSLAAALPTAPA
jgi:hypothetical protein